MRAVPVVPRGGPVESRATVGARPVACGVTGTDTGVGKTVVAAALAAGLTRRGLRVGVFKPIETGVSPVDGPTDAKALRAAAGAIDDLSDVCPCTFEEPLAPMVAAGRARRSIDLSQLDAAFMRVVTGRDAVIVEGAGGLLVPVTETVAYDVLFARWGVRVIVVAANRLGVLNHALLTVRAAEAAGLDVMGIVLNALAATPPGLAERTNGAALQRLLPALPLVAFPYLPDPRHIPALADAAESCGLLALLPPSLPMS